MSRQSNARPVSLVSHSFCALIVATVFIVPQQAWAVPPLAGDFDDDGDVDLADLGHFAECMAGPGAPSNPGPPTTAQQCLAAFDADADSNLDLFDWSQCQLGFTGSYYSLLLGPVSGLTTTWHRAPGSTAAPLGATLQFKVKGLTPSSSVGWSGATEIERGATYAVAENVLAQVGPHTVEVVVNAGAPGEWRVASQLDVVDAPDITCTASVSVPPLLADETSSNETTMESFFPISKSVAQLTQVGSNQYRTSVARELTFTAQTQPAGFEPLMEWSRDGQVLGLGQTLADQVIDSPGSYTFEVGSVAQPEAIQIDTYGVTITSHASFVDIIPGGEPVTFTAVTDPPGYEADITWLSSTLYGTGSPVLGSGPSFTVQFDDTAGTTGFIWLGVRADNAAFVEDITLRCCVQPSEEEMKQWCKDVNAGVPGASPPEVCIEVFTCADCQALGGECFVGACPLIEQTIRVRTDQDPAPMPVKKHTNWTSLMCEVPGPPGCGSQIDPLVTIDEPCDGGQGTFADFGAPDSTPIPADFFEPGSDPFDGVVCLRGSPLGPTAFGDFGFADTLIRRSGDPFDRCDIPPSFPSDPVTVDIEIVALSLVSIEPITVTFNGGQNPELWDVEVSLSPTTTPPPGTLTATKTHCNGGTYVVDSLSVQPLFTFTKVADPGQVLELDTGLEGIVIIPFQAPQDDWVNDVMISTLKPGPVSSCFNPGISELFPTTDCDCNQNGIRDKCDIENGTSDCNANGIPDECEVPPSAGCPTGLCGMGCLQDSNQNCIPDECE